MKLTRRDLLVAAAAATVLPRPSWGFGSPTRLDIAELDLGAGTISRPRAWERVLYEVARITSVETERRSVVVKPEDPALFEHPFAVLLGSGRFADPSDEAVKQIEQYLAYGGFLFVDDTTSDDSSGFHASLRRLMARVFPTRPFAPLPRDHSVNKSFFLLSAYGGRVALYPELEALVVGTQAPVVYARNDISGALDRREDGSPVAACVPGGEAQRTEALKLVVNLILYALTSDYKSDQAHIRQLILDRRLK